MKKFVSLLMICVLCLSLGTACNPNDNDDPFNFETIFKDGTEKTLMQYDPDVPEKNGKISYAINADIGNKNYMRICIDTDVDLVGNIYYTNKDDPSQSNQEKFFIESGTTEFTTFLDAYRSGAFAQYEKTVDKITLQSVDRTRAGTVTLKSVDFSDRSFDPDVTMFIDDGTLRVGTSLGFGGAITYIAQINSCIVEYLDADGNMCIGKLDDASGASIVSEECNLVNVYDLGREIQQSLYWGVGEENGYVTSSEQKYPGGLLYNPIQCGSAGSVGPQIVDYYCTDDEIYIKSYGQDWFVVNQVDPIYFETWLTFDDDGVLIVRNRITSFSQFTNTDDFPISSQETPAFYSVYPLDYYYAETIEGTIFDNTLCAVNGGSCKTSLSTPVEGRYYYSLPQEQLLNSWAAFVTEDKFGLGIYNPYASGILSYSGIHNRSYMYSMNQQTHSDFYKDDYSSYIASCHAYSYGYLATTIPTRMMDFVPLEYSCALYAGDVSQMRTAFENLHTSGTLVKTDIAWPTQE